MPHGLGVSVGPLYREGVRILESAKTMFSCHVIPLGGICGFVIERLRALIFRRISHFWCFLLGAVPKGCRAIGIFGGAAETLI